MLTFYLLLSKVLAPPPQGDTGTFSHYLASRWVWQYTYVDTGQKTTINSRIHNVQKGKVRVLDDVKVKECVKHLFPHLKQKTGGANRAKPNREEDDKHIFFPSVRDHTVKFPLSAQCFTGLKGAVLAGTKLNISSRFKWLECFLQFWTLQNVWTGISGLVRRQQLYALNGYPWQYTFLPFVSTFCFHINIVISRHREEGYFGFNPKWIWSSGENIGKKEKF